MNWSSDALAHFLDPEIIWIYRWDLLGGFWLTVKLSSISFLLSLAPAALIAVVRCFCHRYLGIILLLVVSFVRSVPAVIGVVFIYFALPFVGITLSDFVSVVLILTVIQTVYMSEVFRAALLSVDQGQIDAGRSLGMRMPGLIRHIVLPQSLVVAAPAFASSIIQLVQNTTIASVISLYDLLGEAMSVQTVTGSSAGIMASALLYLLLLLPLVRYVRSREEQLAKAH